jgi:hypothetical protein
MALFTGTLVPCLCEQVLFHPNSGNGKDGVIGAVRLGHYKVVYDSGKF